MFREKVPTNREEQEALMRRHGDVTDFDFLSGKKQNNSVEQI